MLLFCVCQALVLSQSRVQAELRAAPWWPSWLKAQAYCGLAPPEGTPIPLGLSPVQYLVVQFVLFWVVSDLYEWGYHWVGHSFPWTWAIHKHHHVFYNPSPFSVIADEWADQIVRTLPLLLIPLVLPANMDLLYAQFAIFFYAYGVYLHWGFESEHLSAHNPVINSSYHHYYHHAYSSGNNPLYTGFFFKLWDQLLGTVNRGPCVCSRCEQEKGKRSEQLWKRVAKPDYSPLLSLQFWLSSAGEEPGVGAAGASKPRPKVK